MSQSKQQRTIALIILVTLLGIFMIILLVTVVTFFFTRRLDTPDTTAQLLKTLDSPQSILSPKEIDPALALISLGGVAEQEVIAEAIQKSRPETALSVLLFTPFLPDRERAGQFVALGQVYGQDNNKTKAIFSYYQAAQIAIISPDIPDTVRADVLLQASTGLVALNDQDLTPFYLQQTFIIASASPFLQAIQRRAIFERLHKIYSDLDDRAMARQSLDLSANPPALTALTESAMLLAAPQPENPSETSAAESARWLAAQQLAALLVERAGKAPPEAYKNLHDALLAEDEQKLTLLDQQLASTPQLSTQINLLAAEIKWLSIKYRVAKQGYGFSLVPEWEATVSEIESQLGERYSTIFTLYGELIVALPELSQINQATEEAVRREILVGETGQYPDYPREIRKQQLLEVVNQLSNTQPELKVMLDVGRVAGRDTYILKIRN